MSNSRLRSLLVVAAIVLAFGPGPIAQSHGASDPRNSSRIHCRFCGSGRWTPLSQRGTSESGEGPGVRVMDGLSVGHHPCREASYPRLASLGLIFATPKVCRLFPHVLIARSVQGRPTHLILDQYLPPAEDQGNTASCVAWSTAYYSFTYSVARHYQLGPGLLNTPRFLFSPAFVWHQFNHGRPLEPMHLYEAMHLLATQGCASMTEMPWNPADVRSAPSRAAMARAVKYRARATLNLIRPHRSGTRIDLEPLKTWLGETNEPFVIGIEVFDDFGFISNKPGYVYSPRAGARKAGAHALCVIGYDDAKHAFRVINSFGKAWGDNGCVWLSEDYLARCVNEAWGQTPGGPISTGNIRARGIRNNASPKDIRIEPPTE
jgi:hypothetical protein